MFGGVVQVKELPIFFASKSVNGSFCVMSRNNMIHAFTEIGEEPSFGRVLVGENIFRSEDVMCMLFRTRRPASIDIERMKTYTC
jgi:hypothetical protein